MVALSVFAPQVCARASYLHPLFWRERTGEDAAAAEERSSNHELQRRREEWVSTRDKDEGRQADRGQRVEKLHHHQQPNGGRSCAVNHIESKEMLNKIKDIVVATV